MAKGKSRITASAKTIDPTLDALFASSSGPVVVPPVKRYSEAPPPKEKPQTADSDEELPDADEEDDEELSELDSAEGSEDEDEQSEDDSSEQEDEEEEDSAPEPVAKPKKERKRKREEDDIEGKYLSKLAEAEEKEQPAEKRTKKEAKQEKKEAESSETSEEEADEEEDEDEDESSDVPVHESLAPEAENKDKNDQIEKANRTVFLSNVAAEAVTNKAAKRTLEAHLSSVLDKDAKPAQKIDSVRFRSLAFSTGALPKRAAYITSAIMQETTKSANAYVVFSTQAAARKVVAELNGTVVLDRHLRVDSVAHPAATDHRRCVFVGNLGFVDDETIVTKGEDGERVEKKRTKVPADIEEGLWRTFGKQAGKVENVRVVRDPKTRVGKGFAYVQFYDANHVEAALLLDGKKYPPMLPRILRVTRAKAPHKTALAMERSAKARPQTGGPGARGPGSTKYKAKITPEQQSMAGRASRLLGRSGAMRDMRERKGGDRKPRQANGSGVVPKDDIKAPEDFIFEGRRASAKDGRPSDLKFGKRSKGKGGVKKSTKPAGRGARRAQEWRKKEMSS